MLLESILAYIHFSCILAMVVFLTSQAALCRMDWLNAAVVQRLARVDLIYWVTVVAVLASGLARTLWGFKGTSWYWHQPMLHLKIAVFLVMILIAMKPSLMLQRWRKTLDQTGQLPDAAQVGSARRWIMIEAHIMVVIPLFAALLARGVGAR